jgi:hypothetical protein
VSYGSLPPDPSSTWGYPPLIASADRSTSFPPVLPAARPPGRNANSSESWQQAELDVLPYRAWTTDTAYAPVPSYADQELDPAPSSGTRDNSWTQSNNFNMTSLPNTELEQGSYGTAPYHSEAPQPTYTQYPPSIPGSPPSPTMVTPAAVPPLPRHTYTRTLVGPLSANACRLLDEHRKPGIFFLFQDLSVRTEGQFRGDSYYFPHLTHIRGLGAFRLRMRLMNVGA